MGVLGTVRSELIKSKAYGPFGENSFMHTCSWGVAVYCLLCPIWKHSGLQKIKNDIRAYGDHFPFADKCCCELECFIRRKGFTLSNIAGVPNRYKVVLIKLAVFYMEQE